MIPYIPTSVSTLLKLGPIEIHLFGVLVAIGILVGANRARFRGRQNGIEDADTASLVTWAVVCAFLVSHVFDVLLYQPEALAERPLPQAIWLLVNPAAGLSSFGGFLGAFLGIAYWSRREKKPFAVCIDTVIYGLAFGWFFGRMGCFSAHDHPGAFTDFFLAVKYPEGARHDLGFDEALFALVLSGIFAALSGKNRPVGLYAAITCTLYGPVRFGLDFLRVQNVAGADPRYLGLTPAQYGSILLTIVGLVLAARVARPKAAPVSAARPSAR